ncbi:MAG: hypothetical protein NZ805_07885 [Armatimonadetes bacterium]|nr:hypothetical protein [Armatimonadota bacterium]MDW8027382.1 hypothetical protein [Armatimonadota bacterium]
MGIKRVRALSVDIGTSSLRVLIFDSQGQMLPKIGRQLAYEPQMTLDLLEKLREA